MNFENRVIVKIFFTTLILLSASLSEQLFASDSEATTVFQKALALANKKFYRTAARDDNVIADAKKESFIVGNKK
jgi:hypothetical protein